MIFKENSSSANELILPPITQSKTELTPETKRKEEKVENENQKENKESLVNTDEAKTSEPNPQTSIICQNLLQNDKTREVNKKENNRYKLQDNQTIPEENSKISIEENKKSQEK